MNVHDLIGTRLIKPPLIGSSLGGLSDRGCAGRGGLGGRDSRDSTCQIRIIEMEVSSDCLAIWLQLYNYYETLS